MTLCFIGTIESINLNECTIRDDLTKERVTCRIAADELGNLSVGKQAAFLGDYFQGTITVRRFIPRKFLDPLYEEDVITASGEFALLKPLDDPFHEAFQKFLEQEKLLDEEFAEEPSVGDQTTTDLKEDAEEMEEALQQDSETMEEALAANEKE